MTHILELPVSTPSKTQALGIAGARLAQAASVKVVHALRAATRALLRTPEAISRAYLMALCDPFQSRPRADDWSDPSKF